MLVGRYSLNEPRIVLHAHVAKLASLVLRPGSSDTVWSFSNYRALVDTGASRSGISSRVIAEQELYRHGSIPIVNARSTEIHGKYWVNLGLWPDASGSGQEKSGGRAPFVFPQPFEVIDVAANERFEVILGWDVLKDADFSYQSHDRQFEISVRG